MGRHGTWVTHDGAAPLTQRRLRGQARGGAGMVGDTSKTVQHSSSGGSAPAGAPEGGPAVRLPLGAGALCPTCGTCTSSLPGSQVSARTAWRRPSSATMRMV